MKKRKTKAKDKKAWETEARDRSKEWEKLKNERQTREQETKSNR